MLNLKNLLYRFNDEIKLNVKSNLIFVRNIFTTHCYKFYLVHLTFILSLVFKCNSSSVFTGISCLRRY